MNKKLDKAPPSAVLKPKRTSAVPGVIILALLCIALFLTLIIVLYRNDMINLPSFLEKLIGRSQVEEVPKKNDFTSAFLASAKDTPTNQAQSGELFFVGNEALTELITGTEIPKKYYHELVVSYSNEHSSPTVAATQRVRIFKSGDKYRINIKNSNGTEKTVISDGKSVLIQNTQKNQMTERILPISESYKFSLYNEAGIPDTNHLFSLLTEVNPMEQPGDEGTVPPISNYDISLDRSSTRNNVKINFTYNDTQISESFELSLEKGVILSARSSIGGAVYYTITTEVFDENRQISESLFIVPNENE